jgi:hypothetical protein
MASKSRQYFRNIPDDFNASREARKRLLCPSAEQMLAIRVAETLLAGWNGSITDC